MLSFLRGPLLGCLMSLLFVLNTLIWAVPVYFGILCKLLAPTRMLRQRADRFTAASAQTWAQTNVVIADWLIGVEWDLRVPVELSRSGQYLVCANHQSWNDIYALIRALNDKTPFFKFFLKRELIWVPVLGPVWWGLDYPFMQRHSTAMLARHPELRGQDLETTRRACAHYRDMPVTILNFVEGTRFTAAKRRQQKSPYHYLLKPRAGALALSIAVLGEQINSMLDVTIVYPDGARGFWDFLSGRVRRGIVEVRQLRIPREMVLGDYEKDSAFRKRFQAWVGELWAEKDRRIGQILAECGVPATA